ncbi:MAG: restriction endonuclease [Crocinitomicaceae bacterium]|nr:restriction endonuclease [Crocinitomicaceae bacterium]MBK8926607.1 restriction endonuclease [Crocinitomicaceae bacterium]
MAIPRYDEIQFPALKLLSDGQQRKANEFEAPLAKEFNLTEDDVNQMYESGNGPVFNDRVKWALSYLSMAGVVTKPKRGTYQINEDGLKLVNNPNKFREYIDTKLLSRDHAKIKKTNDTAPEIISSQNENTPAESLYTSFQGIKKSVYRELIDTILSKTPREFEKLVVQLLQKMGYGGEIKDSGLVTQYTNDKGIDGVIKEDILGFGRIYIQAKRYKIDTNIQRDEIQKFVGALAVAQSDKGVFITTSDFTKGAYEYVSSLNSTAKIVLINGDKLAEYIYDYNLGLQTEKIIEIKKLDNDYWDLMDDDEK